MPYNAPYVPSADHVFEVDRKSAGSPRSIRPDARRQDEEARRELEVRQTAQRILAEHLSKDDARGWRALDGGALHVSLRGATLVDFDMSLCKMGAADFQYARFVGTTHFEGCEFVGQTHFDSAVFKGPCWIVLADFQMAHGSTALSSRILLGSMKQNSQTTSAFPRPSSATTLSSGMHSSRVWRGSETPDSMAG